MWQRYVNHTAQFLDTTAGAATPGLLDQLTCANTGWTSVASSLFAPTSILPAVETSATPRGAVETKINTNYVYEFGGGQIKMIIPSQAGTRSRRC